MRRFVVVSEKAVPAPAGSSPMPKKKKKATEDGSGADGTIDGTPQGDTADPTDPSDDEPDSGSGADARPYVEDPANADAAASPDAPADPAADEEEKEPAAEQTDPAADTQAPDEDPTTSTPAVPGLPTDTREWAGDLDTSGDETDPADTPWSFTGSDGETAWLDKDPRDGTLVGWVKESDGSVYRYSDPEAWAIDVDDAGMTRIGDAAPDAEPEPTDEPDSETDTEPQTPDDPSQPAAVEADLEKKQHRTVRGHRVIPLDQ